MCYVDSVGNVIPTPDEPRSCQRSGLNWFGARLPDRAPPLCYCFRAISSTFNTKVVKANIVPKNMHKPAYVISVLLM